MSWLTVWILVSSVLMWVNAMRTVSKMTFKLASIKDKDPIGKPRMVMLSIVPDPDVKFANARENVLVVVVR